MKPTLIVLLFVFLTCQVGFAANIRASHLAPRAPTVDVYLNGEKTFKNLPFRTVTDYLSVPDGDYNIAVYAAGETSNPILEAKDVMLEKGNFTITAAGFGPTKSINPVVLRDDLEPLADRPKLRLVNAAPDYLGLRLCTPAGTDIFASVGFKSASPYLAILPLLQDFNVNVGDVNLLRLRNLQLLPGRVYTVFVVGSKTDGTLNYVLTQDKL
jgi:Domain of unknown function (DUF4397)